MNAVVAGLGDGWTGAAALLVVAALAAAAWLAPVRQRLGAGGLHRFLGSALLLALLWSARAEIGPGVSLRLLGVPLLTLILGPALAIWAAALAALLAMLLASLAPAVAIWSILLYGIVPALLTDVARRAVAQWLPAHLFVYILGAGFFSAAVVAVMTHLLASAWVVASGTQSAAFMFGQYAPFLLLMAFGEATLTGMLLTLLVVYLPDWVLTYKDAHYLRHE